MRTDPRGRKAVDPNGRPRDRTSRLCILHRILLECANSNAIALNTSAKYLLDTLCRMKKCLPLPYFPKWATPKKWAEKRADVSPLPTHLSACNDCGLVSCSRYHPKCICRFQTTIHTSWESHGGLPNQQAPFDPHMCAMNFHNLFGCHGQNY